MAEPDLHHYFDVLQNLERLNVPYVVIGAFAGTLYGVTRTTFDVDIVVDLRDDQIEPLATLYPAPRFYADPKQMRDSIRDGILFNIIDTTAGRKVDLIPLSMKPGYGWALERRIRQGIQMPDGSEMEIWVALPQDVIVGKLMAWKEGRSFKHEQDIRDILVAVSLEESRELSRIFVPADVDAWAAKLGEDVQRLWNGLKALKAGEMGLG